MQTEFDLAGVKQDIADMKGDIKSLRTELLSLKRSIYHCGCFALCYGYIAT
ncbi:hypothetical protein [uncultured Helicobacter sp.]|uniref:hypothetical protein n=1 Tax=uncultured Helicobacter sp. TaxID=175537 RepID=UPI00374E621A